MLTMTEFNTALTLFIIATALTSSSPVDAASDGNYNFESLRVTNLKRNLYNRWVRFKRPMSGPVPKVRPSTYEILDAQLPRQAKFLGQRYENIDHILPRMLQARRSRGVAILKDQKDQFPSTRKARLTGKTSTASVAQNDLPFKIQTAMIDVTTELNANNQCYKRKMLFGRSDNPTTVSTHTTPKEIIMKNDSFIKSTVSN